MFGIEYMIIACAPGISLLLLGAVAYNEATSKNKWVRASCFLSVWILLDLWNVFGLAEPCRRDSRIVPVYGLFTYLEGRRIKEEIKREEEGELARKRRIEERNEWLRAEGFNELEEYKPRVISPHTC